jgi:DNA-binding phage protein
MKTQAINDQRLRDATQLVNEANVEYVAALVEMREAGASLAVIAEAAQMSRAGVLKLLRRIDDAAQ